MSELLNAGRLYIRSLMSLRFRVRFQEEICLVKPSNFMLFKYHAIVIIPVLTVLSLLVWDEWSTFLTAPITVGQGSILLTLAVAHRAEAFAKIYERCYRHSGGYINKRNCAIAVRSELTLWGIGLAALARVNGWLKRDEEVRPDGQMNIKVGNETMVHITSFQATSKRDDDSDIGNVRFEVADDKFAYLNANITALEVGDSGLYMVEFVLQQESLPETSNDC